MRNRIFLIVRKSGWVIGFCSALLSLIFLLKDIVGSFEPKFLNVALLHTPVHLGDNVHAHIGGDATRQPRPTRCTEQFSEHVTIFCLDKQDSNILISGAATSVSQFHLFNHARPEISKVNLSAWRHVALVNNTELLKGEIERSVSIGRNSFLIWRKYSGNYYLRVAPFLLAIQQSFLPEIQNKGWDISDFSEATLTLTFNGLTGGKRPDQRDRIFVFVDNELRHINFPSMKTRDTLGYEAKFPIDLKAISIGKTTHIGIYVLPWQEQGPRPPQSWLGDMRGPGHFQDIDINNIMAQLELR